MERQRETERGASSASHKIFMAAALLLREPRLHAQFERGKSEEELGEIFHSVATFQKVHLPVLRMLFLSAMSWKARKGHSSGSDAAQQRSKKGQTKCNSGGGGIHFSSNYRVTMVV